MLGKLLGRDKSPERFPEDAFAIGQGERDGLPAFAMVNLAYKGYQFRADYPWHLQIEITIEDATEYGLCSDAEAEVLNAVEDQLETEMRKTGAVHYVARQTWNGLRMIDYYLGSGDAVERALSALSSGGRVARSFTYKIERDEDWSICEPFFKRF
jgi:hypothetical protein